MEGYPVNILNNTSNVALDNPLPILISLNNSNVTPSNPLSVEVSINTSNVSKTNAFPINVMNNTSNVANDNPFAVSVRSFAPTMSDAFGRLRMTQPFTLFDSFHRFQDNGKISEYTSNTASSSFDTNAGSIVMTVGSNAGDRIYRESARVFAYQPGKSLLVLETFCMSPPKTGLRQRHGYFDTSNGFYLQQDGSNISFVRRSFTSGSVKETVILQDNWNYDPLKGTGISKYTLDLTKSQILFTDIEWLGVGSARMGFIIDGQYCLAHVFHHANQPSTAYSDTTLPYMTTACLPVRAELENTAATGSVSNYRIICTSVISEGGYEIRGRPRSAGITTIDVPVTLAAKNTLYPIVSIRLKSTRLNAIVIPVNFSIIGTTASDFRWALIKNATLAGNSWTSAGDDSSVEYRLDGGDTITDGIIMRSGYFSATNGQSPSISLSDDLFKFQLERNSFTSTSYPFTLAVACKQLNDKVLGSIDWEEIT